MMATREEKNAYSRGYATGKRSADAALAEQRARADDAARRAEFAEGANGVGHCEDCKHWDRGGGRAGWENCAWGDCRAPRAPGTPWGCWMHADDGKPISTTPRFGCVLFLAKSAPDGGGEHF